MCDQQDALLILSISSIFLSRVDMAVATAVLKLSKSVMERAVTEAVVPVKAVLAGIVIELPLTVRVVAEDPALCRPWHGGSRLNLAGFSVTQSFDSFP